MTSTTAGGWRATAQNLIALIPGPVLAALIAPCSVLFLTQALNDGDTYWHIAAGGWMIDHLQVLHTDVFSHTYAGRPWASHEWLSEIFMALAFRAGGWAGLLLLYGAIMSLAAWMLARGVGRWLGGVGQAVALVLALFAAAPSILARPHLLMLPVLLAWMLEMMAARDQDRAPRWPTALLMVIWANLHGSFVFGFILAGAFGLEALIYSEDRVRVIRTWGLFGVLTLLAALATPHGVAGLIAPFQILSMKTLNTIVEWRPPDFSKFSGLEAAILVTLLICFWQGVRVPLIRLLLALLLLHMTLQHQRQELVLAVLTPLLLARPIGEAAGRAEQDNPVGRGARVTLAIGLLALAILRLALPAERVDDPVTPRSALAHVPAAIAAKPVLNAYDFGGYLIFKGVKTFIDGRADMYGDDFVKLYVRTVDAQPATVDKVFKRYGVTWTLLQPRHALVKVLDKDPAWKRIYADKYAVVHVRADALAQAGAAPPAPASAVARPR